MLPAAEVRHAKLNLLTQQERECLRLVAQQRSSKEIAQELGISKASVDTYCNRARAKLGVASRREAAQLVLEAGAATPLAGFPTPQLAPAAAAPAVVALLPPVSSLGPAARLTVIVGGAVALTLAFGVLISSLQSLTDVVETVRGHRRAAPAAAQAAP